MSLHPDYDVRRGRDGERVGKVVELGPGMRLERRGLEWVAVVYAGHRNCMKEAEVILTLRRVLAGRPEPVSRVELVVTDPGAAPPPKAG